MKRVLILLVVALVMAAVFALSGQAFAAQCDGGNNPHCFNPGGQPKGANQHFVNPSGH